MDLEQVMILRSEKDGDERLNGERWIDRLFPSVGFLEDPKDPSFDLASKEDLLDKKRDKGFIDELDRSIEVVHSFYGLEINAFGLLQPGKSNEQIKRFNLYFKGNRGGNNYRRITRILFCLGLFDRKAEFRRWKICLFSLLFSSGRTTLEPPGEGKGEYPFLNLWRMARCFFQEDTIQELPFKEEQLVEISSQFGSIRDFRIKVKDNKQDSFEIDLDDRESFLAVTRKIHPYDKPIEFYSVSKEDNRVVDLGSISWHIVFEPLNWNRKMESFFLILLPDFAVEIKKEQAIDLDLYLTENLSLKLSLDAKGNPTFVDKNFVVLPKKKKGVVVPKIKVDRMFVDPMPVGAQTLSTRQIVSFLVPLY